MKYRERIKFLMFIKEVMATSDESRKYVYELMNNAENIKLGSLKLATNLIKVEEKYDNHTRAIAIYTQPHLALLLKGISVYTKKEEHGDLIKLMMRLLIVGEKEGVLSQHQISASYKDFTVKSSSGLFSKTSHHLTPAMLEYVISNGSIKKDSKGNIPSDIADKLIENTLLFHSSKNTHDKFIQTCGKTSIKSPEDMEAELKNVYKIKGSVPQYITDLAYSMSLGNITLVRNDRLIVTYKNREKKEMRVNMDLWDYKLFLDSLLRGDGIARVINSFTRDIVQKR